MQTLAKSRFVISLPSFRPKSIGVSPIGSPTSSPILSPRSPRFSTLSPPLSPQHSTTNLSAPSSSSRITPPSSTRITPPSSTRSILSSTKSTPDLFSQNSTSSKLLSSNISSPSLNGALDQLSRRNFTSSPEITFENDHNFHSENVQDSSWPEEIEDFPKQITPKFRRSYDDIYDIENKSKQSKIRSSLELPAIKLQELPKLTNFSAPKKFFSEKILEGNQELDKIWVAPDAVADSYRTIFPEVVESRSTTKITEDEFKRWDDPAENQIMIEVDDNKQKTDEDVDFLAVGGPSALTGTLMHKLRNPKSKAIYAVAGRNDSNHDGSAYYFHERDAFPVYINKVNRGPYCIYADIRKRIIQRQTLVDECVNNRHHVKISMNWSNISLRKILNIFIPNFWHMSGDIYLKDPKKTLMRHCVEHAKTTSDIISTVTQKTRLPKEALLIQGKDRACYVGFKGGVNPDEHFTWLNGYTEIPFYKIKHEKAFGEEVNMVVAFPRDGLISPWIMDNLKNELQYNQPNTNVRQNFHLKKILVKRDPKDPSKVNVTKVIWQDMTTNKTKVIGVKELLLSLGPSAQLYVKPVEYTISQHIKDIISHYTSNPSANISELMSSSSQYQYSPKIKSLMRHLINKFIYKVNKGKVYKEFMWAAGSSNVMIIGVDVEKTPKEKMEVYRKFMDGVNQHWTLIAEREVLCKGKKYRYFAIQMTGGGNFPSRKITPDYVLNLLHTTEKMMGLDKDKHVVSYDLIQTRGCGRAVSAKNSVAFAPLATNAVANYALGGIGMTTMFPNGELMVQMLEHLQGKGVGNLNEGIVGNMQLSQMLHSKNVLEGVDYTTLVDDKSKVARLIGFDESFPLIEKIKKMKNNVFNYFSATSKIRHQPNGAQHCTIQN